MNPLEEYRAQIDAIDGELVQLFLQRMAVTQKVGEYKKANGIPAARLYSPTRAVTSMRRRKSWVSPPSMASICARYSSKPMVPRPFSK